MVPVLRLGISTGILDKQWMARVGRAYAEACAWPLSTPVRLLEARRS